MALETQERNSIILGAVNMTGPVGDNPSEWEDRVVDNAKLLTTMLSETSAAGKAVEMLSEAKKFIGTIVYVGKEKSSKRGFVVFKTGTDRDEDGHGLETARTEIVDGNASATKFCKDMRTNLVGHRVVCYIEMQPGKDPNRKFRILQHVTDLGEDNTITEDDIAHGLARAGKEMKG